MFWTPFGGTKNLTNKDFRKVAFSSLIRLYWSKTADLAMGVRSDLLTLNARFEGRAKSSVKI